MNLSFCPIDDDPPPMPVVMRRQKRKQPSKENTECNYIVMFFIVGVFLLVIKDQLK
jgi:hypothetical protein